MLTFIRGPWCDSEIVSERRIVRRFMEIWPKLAVMPEPTLIAQLQECGFDRPHLQALERILARQKKLRQQLQQRMQRRA